MTYQSTVSNSKRPRARARRYTSPLRAEQAAQTRIRILQAFGDVVTTVGDALTVQQVAAQAGVSVPTLYRNFASLDALADAFWDWLLPQLANVAAVKTADDLALLTASLFKRFHERAALSRALATTAAGRRLRARGIEERKQMFVRALAPLTRRLPDRDARAAAAICKVLSSVDAWKSLYEDWGLDGEESGRAAAWALGVLVQALRRDLTSLKPVKGSR